jgi:hypothetical protein
MDRRKILNLLPIKFLFNKILYGIDCTVKNFVLLIGILELKNYFYIIEISILSIVN